MERIFKINPWNITAYNLPKEDMCLVENTTSIGNDYMGIRGSFEEGYSGDSLSGTYLAGVWFPDRTRVGWWRNGYPEYFGKSTNASNFVGIQILVDGGKVDLAKCDFSDYYQNLDMHQDLFTRGYAYRDKSGIKFTFERFLSNRVQEAALIKLKA